MLKLNQNISPNYRRDTIAKFYGPKQSQVYFPKTAEDRYFDGSGKIRDKNQDIKAANQIYSALAKFAKVSRNKCQVVLDHAGKGIWRDIEGISIAEDWHNGRALFPSEWIDIN